MTRVVTAVEDVDLLDWLEAQVLYPKVYWESQDGSLKMAGAGAALISHTIPHVEKGSSLRFFGGRSFCQKTWGSFPSTYFFVPQMELEQKEGKTHLILNLTEEKEIPILPPLNRSYSPPLCLKREDSLDKESWSQEIKNYLELIQKRSLEKIVCARQTCLTFNEKIAVLPLLKKLKEKAKRATLFAFLMNENEAFLGATPERLYERRGKEIRCDVLAGTAPLGSAELLKNPKERSEFASVKGFIHRVLLPLCSSFHLDQDEIITTSHLHHLYSRFTAVLKEDMNDETLISCLHPTPAVAGFPKEKSLELIRKRENFIRGWYTAPVGWIAENQADICVGIRSAYIQGEIMNLFSGAGIVAGSEPLKEWEELESKINLLLEILDVSCQNV